jgi:phage host-nuclease inhibitor protein Gam
MARQRVESGIKSWEEADQALLRIGRLERGIELYEAGMQEEIEKAKAAGQAAAAPLQQEKGRLVLQLQAFCEGHREEMKGKSRRLNYGTVGFRQSARIVIKAVKSCVAALKALGFEEYLIVKETPNKERLKELTDEALEKVGARRVTEDAFGYEVDRERVQEAA